MEFSEIINEILYILLTMILPIIAAYTVNLIKAGIRESNIIAEAVKNETIAQTVESALSDVMDAVLYVNQIYTDSLKASGRFDDAAQKKAFQLAYTEALNQISDETKKIIEQLYGSFDQWLKLKIESSVGLARKQERM